MGNVGASSKPIQDAKFDLKPNLLNADENEEKQKQKLENPGTMEELHKKTKGLCCCYGIQAMLLT